MRIKVKYLFGFLLLFCFCSNLSARTIHKERSIYRNIVIVEQNNKRCMRFETRRRSVSNQACINLQDQDKLVFEYTQSLMAGLAFNPSPKRILIIGLGGGTLPKTFAKILPQTEVVSVEIDPAVAKLAKKYFYYEENDKTQTAIKDGRVYIKRALKKQQTFDWIILDAFNGDYIPEHLLTVEFLTEAKSLLVPGGLLSANTFNGSRLYDYESVTYQSVFKELQILHSVTKGNRIIFACNCEKLSSKINVDQQLKTALVPFGVDLDSLVKRLSSKIDWDTSVPPLTDQFSPANLLNQ